MKIDHHPKLLRFFYIVIDLNNKKQLQLQASEEPKKLKWYLQTCPITKEVHIKKDIRLEALR